MKPFGRAGSTVGVTDGSTLSLIEDFEKLLCLIQDIFYFIANQ
jgi:hypothetical protein